MMNVVRSGWLLLLTVAVGCGDGRVALPTAPVAGTVAYQGKPLSTGRIVFLHQSGQGVTTDITAEGTFKLAVFQGNNQVAISCFAPDAPSPNSQARPGPPIGKSLIPERYMSCNTSGLTFEVKPDTNRFDVDLQQ
jgi:hypothetical protein